MTEQENSFFGGSPPGVGGISHKCESSVYKYELISFLGSRNPLEESEKLRGLQRQEVQKVKEKLFVKFSE